MNPMLAMSPVGAVYAMQGRTMAQNAEGMGTVLQDMAGSLEAAEWTMIFCALLSAFTMSFALVFTILIHAAWRVEWWWYYVRNASVLLASLCIVFLIEPRPSHWWPWLQNCKNTLSSTLQGRFSLTECKLRLRRWWKWRTRYATKTKLNV